MKLRKLIFNLHLYLGLGVGLLLSVTGLTGSLLVFRHEIEALLDPQVHHVEGRTEAGANSRPPVSPQTALETVRREYPDDPVGLLYPPQGAREVYELSLKSGQHVYLHPATGAVLGVRDPERTPMGFLFALHTELLSGEAGETAVGIGGLVLLLLGGTGVFLWWPGKKSLRQGFRVRWGASWKRVNYDLHRVGGALAVLLLGLIALTGAALVFGVLFTDAVHWLTRTPPPPPRAVSTVLAGREPLPLDDLLRRADAALPGTETTRIVPAGKPEAALVVRKKLPGELHPNGMCFVYLDQYAGTVLRVEDASKATVGPRLLFLRYPLHIGSYAGLLTRVVYVLVGLTPALLFGTGCLMWWNRWTGKQRRSQGKRGRRFIPAERLNEHEYATAAGDHASPGVR